MGTKLFLITTANKVYGTYYKTICFEQSFTNEKELENALLNAKSTLCSYALTFGSVFIQNFETDIPLTSEGIFNFLDLQH